MKFNSNILAIIIIIFVFGLYYYANFYNLTENMENKKPKKSSKGHRCPNMLIEKDGEILLYNSKVASVPGVNPLKFKSLDEYAEFVDWQKSQGIECDILYLQYTTDTQNNDLIQIKPSIFENNGGLPSKKPNAVPGKPDTDYFEENKILDATLNSTPDPNVKFNTGMYAGYDEQNQDIGLNTPLDMLYHENNADNKSRNPMDNNWGGKDYTKDAINRGEYVGREIFRY